MAGTHIIGGPYASGLSGAQSSGAGVLNSLGLAKFNATKPSLLDTQLAESQATSRAATLVVLDELPQAQDDTNGVIAMTKKPLAVSTYARTVSRSTALEASRIAKATAGTLRSVSVRLDSTAATATYYVQILDSATLPADGAVTTLVAPRKIIHTNGTDDFWTADFTEDCIFFTNGCVVVLSTTEFTKTISTALLSMTVELT